MKKYLEYFYLTAAIALMVAYALWGKDLSTTESYGLIGGIVIFSFLFSIRRTLRRVNQQKSVQTKSRDSQ